MYQLVSAIVKPLEAGGRWRGMDIGNVAMRDLFTSFKRVIATLSNTVLTKNVSLDLETLRLSYGGSALSFNDFLTANGNKALVTTDEVITINTRYAKYADAVHAGYKLTPTHERISPSSTLNLEQKDWLVMTKDGADYKTIYKNCLVNVNGFYHQTDYSDDGLYIVDGMLSCKISNRNECGILSFLELGELSFLPIKDEQIYTQKEGQVLASNCYVDTGIDLSNKTVMLVLGGYLHVLDKRAFYRISKSAFGIDFGYIPLIDRFYEQHGVINLSSLELETTIKNFDQVGVQDLYSDAVLRKYLQLSQTFFVVLENDDIFVESIGLDKSPYPGNYVAFTTPVYPVVMGRGRHETYWPRLEADRYSLAFNSNATWQGYYNYDTTKTRDLNSVAPGQLASLGYQNEEAHFLLIGSDV